MDLQDRIDELEGRKKRFGTNRGLSLIAAVYIIYSAVKDVKEAPAYFLIIMTVIVLALGAIALFGTKQIKKLQDEIDVLVKELEEFEKMEEQKAQALDAEKIDAPIEETNELND